jgi:alpha-galactosidase
LESHQPQLCPVDAGRLTLRKLNLFQLHKASVVFHGVLVLSCVVSNHVFGQTNQLVSGAVIPAEILTPAASDMPRINGPNIFGVRPCSPFLFGIPATGKRPMKFSARGLPKGLKLDQNTGRITGALKQPGKFVVQLRAKNVFGVAEKSFRIVVGEQIALTPPLGWNSWNCWGDKVDADKVLRSARALVASGLDQHGWSYINIDDAWQGARGGPHNALQPDPQRFPDIKSLCDNIHNLGLKAGIYSTPWTVSYAGRPGGSAENPDGKWNPYANFKAPRNKNVLPFAIGKYSFTQADAAQWATWGIDYLKFDWGPVTAPPAVAMHQALRATGRDIIKPFQQPRTKVIQRNQGSFQNGGGLAHHHRHQ